MNLLANSRDLRINSIGEAISTAESRVHVGREDQLKELFEAWRRKADLDSQVALSIRRPEFAALVALGEPARLHFLRHATRRCQENRTDGWWWLAVTEALAAAQGDEVAAATAPRLEALAAPATVAA